MMQALNIYIVRKPDGSGALFCCTGDQAKRFNAPLVNQVPEFRGSSVHLVGPASEKVLPGILARLEDVSEVFLGSSWEIGQYC